MIAPSGCSLARTAPTSARSWVTRTVSPHSQWHPDGRVYSGSEDTTIRVWSSDNGKHLQTHVGHTRTVWAIVVGPDGNVYSGSRDGTVRVWSGKTGGHLHTCHSKAGFACSCF
jgi:WD40 repeat protein